MSLRALHLQIAGWRASSLGTLAAVAFMAIIAFAPETGARAREPGSQLWGSSSVDVPRRFLRFGRCGSPDGSVLFVAGTRGRPFRGPDFATVAYDAASGRRIWSSFYSPKGDGQDYAFEVEVSPDGSSVFVAGPSQGAESYDYVSIAYDASDGDVIWKKRFDGGHFDYPSALAVSPDGGMIFLTGRSTKPGQRSDYLTLGQAAQDGDVIWHERYDGPSHGGERGHALVVSPDSSSVFVTGVSKSTETGPDFATVAYRASTGASLWTKRFSGPGTDSAFDLSMSPTGETVFVTGHTYSGPDTGRDYVTFAYSTTDGDVLDEALQRQEEWIRHEPL